MSRTASVLVLLLAAVFEACGDALMRTARGSSTPALRAILFTLAAAVLFLYGWTVNSPPWDFGRLLGLYVVFFFLIAQVLSWAVFGNPPSRAVILGGVLIVAGGLVIAVAQT